MDVWLLANRLARRWYLTFPLVLGAAVLALVVAQSVRATYSAETQVLLAPGGAAAEAAGNPLLLATRNQLDAATQSVAFVLDSPAAADERRAAQPGADVTFSLVEEAPIVVVSVSADDPGTVGAATEVAVEQLERSLRGIEDPLGAVPSARIDTVQLSEPSVVEEIGDRRRVFLGVLVGGLLAAALVVLALDQLLRRRLERRLTADLDREVGRLTGGLSGGPAPRHRPA